MSTQNSGTMNRAAAVAGQFYPSDPQELKSLLRKYFSTLTYAPPKGEVMAIISPHAGYVYSGEVAAAAFNQADPEKTYHTIFVIGLSHRNSYAGASIYTLGNYETPLGEVTVDLPLARKLAGNKDMGFDPAYQRSEHSLEVQMPFLQYHLKNPFKVVPILLGTTDTHICRNVAKALEPYFVPGNLFVISTDFSHYPSYNVAKRVDKSIADAIVTNDPDRLLAAVESSEKLHETNLATAICSWPGVYTLLEITHDKPGIHITPLLYRNSGDSEFGQRDRVVGYYALAVTRENDPGKAEECIDISKADQEILLDMARRTIRGYLTNGEMPDANPKTLPPSLLEKRGVFVSLHMDGALRGCIGHFEGDKPLWEITREMAIASSTRDHRFQPVTLLELKKIDIEISVLSPLRKISSYKEFILGKQGIFIKKGNRSGTFLPQVATETGWTREEFLGHCSRDKAGIGWDGWKDAELFVYEACIFGEKPK